MFPTYSPQFPVSTMIKTTPAAVCDHKKTKISKDVNNSYNNFNNATENNKSGETALPYLALHEEVPKAFLISRCEQLYSYFVFGVWIQNGGELAKNAVCKILHP